MKKLIITASLGLIIPLMSMAQTTLGPGTITTSLTQAGSPHNFANQSWNTYVDAGHGNQICQPCHTPHNAKQPNLPELTPLWNHTLSTAAYTFYSSIKTSAGTLGVTAITGTSKLCLSCHDGSVALGAFGGQTGSTTMDTYNSGLASFGTDLSNDHPISVNYNAARVTYGAGGLNDENTYIYNTAYDATAGTYTPGTTKTIALGYLDAAGEVQCTSCHSAHSNKIGYQLRQNNRGSVLCLACHKK